MELKLVCLYQYFFMVIVDIVVITLMFDINFCMLALLFYLSNGKNKMIFERETCQLIKPLGVA